MSKSRYGAGVKTRLEQIQVRLLPSVLGHPIQVKLTPSEREALQAAADEHTEEGQLSVFLRDLALVSASHLYQRATEEAPADRQTAWVIETAAVEMAMLPGEFMRWVALEAIGYTKGVQIGSTAKDALAGKALKAKGE